ncbi:hypothetical protein [Streptantibioticus cattleyicolor]|uniref:Uncharacterized protein n=1 Tax=Streptantibioticus cattleyicolor (strain ATCC 35852 / DSM 46488 / JCM 4925 / NBRC 14057 / NRRL 8057) TaxID=1003195 RepID=F8JMI2_STREN|nr:hypothetical protein [Streptantibioticus cattleyicolor]AEW99336.1 hypothetical protein SCATT_p11430 [Streptantibioticus cattleyicolor NRRL 8057 = DSM 46488]CCB71623.1 conserved protein of unknown function [Streptantibioticus cattleyicolor NRRL 8057 = DSM 46488]
MRNTRPDQPGTGDLSTEDLAGTTAGEPPTPPDAPQFPGEAIDTGTKTETETETEPEPEPEPEAEPQAGAEEGPTAAEPVGGTTVSDADKDTDTDRPGTTEESLLGDAGEDFRNRWQEIQSGFVDRPEDSVHQADALVAEVMQALAASFAEHKQQLEHQWHSGAQVPTEDLRVALQRYRTFFNRLLSA